MEKTFFKFRNLKNDFEFPCRKVYKNVTGNAPSRIFRKLTEAGAPFNVPNGLTQ